MDLIHQNGPVAKLARSKMTPQIIAVLGCLVLLPGALRVLAPVSFTLLRIVTELCQFCATALSINGF